MSCLQTLKISKTGRLFSQASNAILAGPVIAIVRPDAMETAQMLPQATNEDMCSNVVCSCAVYRNTVWSNVVCGSRVGSNARCGSRVGSNVVCCVVGTCSVGYQALYLFGNYWLGCSPTQFYFFQSLMSDTAILNFIKVFYIEQNFLYFYYLAYFYTASVTTVYSIVFICALL